MAQKMLEASMQKSILTNVGNLTTNIISKFANAFDAGQIEDGKYKNLDRISECFVDELIKSLQ